MPRKASLFLIVALTIFLANACNLPGEQTPAPTPSPPSNETLVDTFPVDPTFSEFYNYLGGADVLGRAITPLQIDGSRKSQYLESGLMVYDPQAPGSERHRLAPLGIPLDVAEPGVGDPGDPDLRYINGHVIYPEFVEMYEKLGGAQFVGLPLTEARHNPEKNRIEQYFENLGFYRLDWEDPGTVRLMAYGAIACNQRCRYQPPSSSIPGPRGFLPEPFSSTASRLGLTLLGRTLSEPHMAEDGYLELIFENVVLVMEPVNASEEPLQTKVPVIKPQAWLPLAFMSLAEQAGGEPEEIPGFFWLPLVSNRPSAAPVAPAAPTAPSIFLRPIVEILGIGSQPPVQRMLDALTHFFAVDGDLGYNIPNYFYEWIERNGGLETSGPPVGEVFPAGGGVFRQCFSNLCLDMDPNVEESRRLRPAPLGLAYLERFYREAGDFRREQSLEGVSLHVWEGKPFVSPQEDQQIYVSVTEGGEPLANREPALTLTLPDNSQQVYTMEPTDEKGKTVISIPPVDAVNATLIAYDVCLTGIGGKKLCASDHYLIWENP